MSDRSLNLDSTPRANAAPAGTPETEPMDTGHAGHWWAGTRYSRVYDCVTTDPKFATVYDDDAAFATWVRLLMTANGAWPVPAAIPRRTDQRALDLLVSVGLVYLQAHDLYTISGLGLERGARVEQARAAGRASAVQRQSNASPTPAERQPNLAEHKQSRAEQSRAVGSIEPTRSTPLENDRGERRPKKNGQDPEPTSLRAILDPATAARLGIAPEETNP